MKSSPKDFKIGEIFHYRNSVWKVTDIGTRTITVISLSEVWVTRSRANTHVKERVRLEPSQFGSNRFNGPPYSVPELVFDERAFESCVSDAEWQEARRILGLGVTSAKDIR
jgi:hypothetical protein